MIFFCNKIFSEFVQDCHREMEELEEEEDIEEEEGEGIGEFDDGRTGKLTLAVLLQEGLVSLILLKKHSTLVIYHLFCPQQTRVVYLLGYKHWRFSLLTFYVAPSRITQPGATRNEKKMTFSVLSH